MKPTVGFIGLGVLGMPAAERLLEQGILLAVWNRTVEKAAPLVRPGATLAASPRELAVCAKIVITMVTDGPALEAVALGPDGLAAALAPGKVHCDMSTIDPDTSRRLAAHYAGRAVHFLHAPVLGSKRAAATGTLLILAGGPRAGFQVCEPVFAVLRHKSWHWEQAPRPPASSLPATCFSAG